MADPTLARGGTNFETSGSTTLTLYNTQTESIRKSANLITLPIPASDSSDVIAFDLMGVTREFTIRGTFTTSDNADAWKFVDDLNSLIDGTQGDTGSSQVGYTYTSRAWNDGQTNRTPEETFTVYVNDVSVDWQAGEPNTVRYSVTLLEVSGSSA